MISGIYEIINLINGKRYIGSAVDLKKRKREHFRGLHQGDHYNRHLQRAWNKYGSDTFIFEPLMYCLPEYLIFCEQYYLDEWKPEYNECRVAGSPLGYKHTQEQRANNSVAQKGKKLTPEHKAKISKALMGNQRAKGYKYTPEQSANRSAILMGNQRAKKKDGRNTSLA